MSIFDRLDWEAQQRRWASYDRAFSNAPDDVHALWCEEVGSRPKTMEEWIAQGKPDSTHDEEEDYRDDEEEF